MRRAVPGAVPQGREGLAGPPPLPPLSRTNWTRLVPPSVLTGHVSSLLQSVPRPARERVANPRTNRQRWRRLQRWRR